MPPDFRVQNRGLLIPQKDCSPGDRLQRYEQLKVSVQALRSQLRPRTAPVSTPDVSGAAPSVPAQENPSPGSLDVSLSSGKSDGGGCAVKETACAKVLRLQSEVLHQEEIAKLREKLNDKAKKIEALTAENAKQKKKLDTRIHFYDKKSRALEIQVAEETARVKEELATQALEHKLKAEEMEDIHKRTVVDLRNRYDATITALEEKHESYRTNSGRTLEDLNTSSGFLREKVGRLEDELAAVCIKYEEERLRHQREDKERNVKLKCITKIQEDHITALRKEMETDKAKWDRERTKDEVRRASEIQGYKLQKVKEIDTIAERVKLALETKDTIILQLKSEMTKLHQHLDQTTQIIQEQASDLLQDI